MVLKYKTIKASNVLNFTYLLSFIYLVVNFIYLVWYIANPEGFWGFNYFLELIIIGIIIIAILFIAILLVFIFFNSVYKILKKESTFKELLKSTGIVILVLLLTGFNFLYERGLSIYLTKKLSDKYSYLKRTELYLKEGDKVGAFAYAKSAYEKEIGRKEISNYLFLAKLYSNTDFDKKQKLISKYSALINYSNCLKQNPKFLHNSEMLFEDALSLINSKLVESERKNLSIFPILSLAEINLQKANYYIAENYFSRLFTVSKSSKPEDVFYIITINLLFADQSLRTGDVNKAMKIQIENLSLYEENNLNQKSSDYLSLLLMAANSELYFENFEHVSKLLIKAIPLAKEREKKEIFMQFLGVKARYCYLAAINNVANEEILDKNYWEKVKELVVGKPNLKEQFIREAETCLIKFVNITKERSGLKSYEYIESLNQLALFYASIGKIKFAKAHLDLALKILKPFKENNKDLYYTLLLNLIAITKNANQTIIEEIQEHYYKKIKNNFLFLNEDERLSLTLNTEKKINIINTFYATNISSNATIDIYNNILALKNLTLYSNRNIREYLNALDPVIKNNYLNLLDKKHSSHKHSSSYINELSLNNNIRKFIEKITSNSSNTIDIQSTKWSDIKNALQNHEVAIEIFNIPTNINGKVDKKYFALIINNNSNYPEIVHLFFESELLNILNQKGNTKRRINLIYNDLNKKLYTLIWGNIEKKISSNHKIYLSISGLLHTISFPALLNNRSIDVSYLGCTKSITGRKFNKDNNKKNIVLFGNIDYGKNDQLKVRDIEKSSIYNPLIYTEKEIQQIKKLFEKENMGKTLVFSKNRASEKNFKKLSGKDVDIIHIASHGFYNKNGYIFDEKQNYQNTLFNSGLVFSNANLKTFDKEDDGILNSFEISQMDLSNVDLVVLSACESGLGDIQGSEGVLGLQRAFKLAGVKSLIVSLWQVPDKPTSELMIKFYEYYLSGLSKKESLLKAQEYLKQKYTLPFYWGGFILIE